MPVVVFERSSDPRGIVVVARAGESLFEIARRADVPVATACVGRATCGLCRVKILGGEEHLSPQNADEKKHLGNTYFITRLRLSCQARVLEGDHARVTVRIPDARKKP